MAIERLEFLGASGDRLAARLDRPLEPPRAFALFAHCFTCTKDIAAASRIARALTDHGIAVLRFDFTGLGSSKGEFANTNFSSNVGDLVAAAAHLREHLRAPALLIGHSLGGAAVLAAAAEIPEVRAVATIGAPYDPAHVTHLFADRLETIDREGEAAVKLAGRPFRINKQFLDDVSARKLDGHLSRLGRALLVMHSPIDEVVGIENAARIFQAAKHPKSFVSLDDADHLLRNPRDARYVASVLAAWADRFLDEPAVETAPEGIVEVRERGVGKFQQTVRIGRHHFVADEPKAYGGDDEGPTPYDLLLAGLGACTAMTVRLYADRKRWPLEGVRVRLRHQKRHADDCAESPRRGAKIDHIDRDLKLEGDLDADQRARLLEIAERCPVHRTLHAEVRVDTRLDT